MMMNTLAMTPLAAYLAIEVIPTSVWAAIDVAAATQAGSDEELFPVVPVGGILDDAARLSKGRAAARTKGRRGPGAGKGSSAEGNETAETAETAFGRNKPPRQVGEILENVDDVLANPDLLKGLRPHDVISRFGGKAPKGWRVEKLAHGRHAGQGFMLRQYTPAGKPTGRMIQWHPGGGHHGELPYWKVNAGHGPVRVGPQF